MREYTQSWKKPKKQAFGKKKCEFGKSEVKFLSHIISTDVFKKYHWYWGCEQLKAFHSLKQELFSAPVLKLYDPNRELKISD